MLDYCLLARPFPPGFRRKDVLQQICRPVTDVQQASTARWNERTRVDVVGVLVGDLNAELLLDGHDHLDGIERVEAEVVGEVGGGLDLVQLASLPAMSHLHRGIFLHIG